MTLSPFSPGAVESVQRSSCLYESGIRRTGKHGVSQKQQCNG